MTKLEIGKPRDAVSLRTWCLVLCCVMSAVVAWRIGTMRSDIGRLERALELVERRIEARDKGQSGRRLTGAEAWIRDTFSEVTR